MNIANKVWQPHAMVGRAAVLEEALNPQRGFQPSSHLTTDSRRTLNNALNISSNILKYPAIKTKATSVEAKRRKAESLNVSPVPKGYGGTLNRSINHEEASLELVEGGEKPSGSGVWPMNLESLPFVQDVFKNYKSSARDIDTTKESRSSGVSYININSLTQFLQEKSFDTSQEYLGPVVTKKRGIWRGYTRRQHEDMNSQFQLKGHSSTSLAHKFMKDVKDSVIFDKDSKEEGNESITLPQLDSNKSLLYGRSAEEEKEKTSRSLAEPEKLQPITGNSALLNRANRVIKGYRPTNFEGLAGKEAGGKSFGKSKVVLGFVNRAMSTSMHAETGRALVNLQEIVGNSLVEQKNLQASGNFKKNTLMQMVRGRNFNSISEEKGNAGLPLIEEDRRDEELERTKGMFRKKFLLDVTLLGDSHNKSTL